MAYLHATIDVNGVKLEVIGSYFKGEDASFDSQGEPESVEIESIFTPKGDDISGLIADNVEMQTAVEELTIQAHKEGVLCAAEDHADCVRKGEFK